MSWMRVGTTVQQEYSFVSTWYLSIPSSGPKAGDLAVLSITTYAYSRTINSEPDWTKVYQNADDAILQAVYWKVLETDDLGTNLSWTFSSGSPGNASLSFYRYRTESTVNLVDWSLNTALKLESGTYSQPNTPAVEVPNDRCMVLVIQTQNDVMLLGSCYLRNSDGAWPDAGEGDDILMSPNIYVYDDPFTRTFDCFTINDDSSPSVSGTYYTWSTANGSGDDYKAACFVFEHTNSSGIDPWLGYGNDVYGVPGYNIASVFGVDTADINSVFGAE